MALFDWLSSIASGSSLAPQSLRSKIASDPYYRFQTAEEIKIAASLGIRIDANRASVDDWLRLPGLSIHQARVLVELAQSGVQFHCLEDVAAALNMTVQRLQPLEPVLLFCYYEAASVYTISPMNANTATVAMLTKIPGVDTYVARAIVENRKTGPYRNLIHLQRRLSLPAALTTELMHYLKF